MGITVTVDMANTPPSELIRLAKFMLEGVGYVAPQDTAVTRANDRAVEPVMEFTPRDGHMTEESARVAVQLVSGAPFAPGTPEAAFRDGVLLGQQVAAQVPPPPQAPGIEVDSQGFPWDVRIHSSSRAKVADGTWRQRRNLDPSILSQVEGELRQTMRIPASTTATVATSAIPSVPTAPVASVPAPTASVPVPPPFVPSVVVPAAPVATTAPPSTAQVGAVTTASPTSGPTFPQLMQSVTRAFAAKELDQVKINEAMVSIGLPGLPMLASRPDLVGAAATALGLAL